MAATLNLSVDQGTTYTHNFTVQNADGTVRDLTGYTARMNVRRNFDFGNILIDATTSNGKLSLTPTQGIVTLELEPSDTSDIRFAGEALEGVYDLELVAPTGDVYRPLEGAFVINREVTR